jgi:aquaporin Z
MSLGKRATAEFLGTFWLVLGGCGSAVRIFTEER